MDSRAVLALLRTQLAEAERAAQSIDHAEPLALRSLRLHCLREKSQVMADSQAAPPVEPDRCA
ncbi:hypothetical protein [Ramlibacter sp.]|uniref:hypothetical protein n=1 Tax=Ramlibacter sp. TaxID=1917967 RepID=UPI003D1401A8